MYLKKLSLLNFKNYRQAEIAFSPFTNCIAGNNGEGKTNLLDAIVYLSFCKSYFNAIDTQNISHGEPQFIIQGEFDNEGHPDTILCSVKRNHRKTFSRNKKEYQRLADHIGLFPVVMVSPSDSILIEGGSEERRRFIDLIISQYNKIYLDNLINYNKSLLQRNALLRQFSESNRYDTKSIEPWDHQMALYGGAIYSERCHFIEKFTPIFQKYHELITGGTERVALVYESQLSKSDLGELLKIVLEKDRFVQHSTAGIHKDDLVFSLNGYPIKKFGSQGQQKSYLVALKLAQREFIKGTNHITPILLLDDIFDKLDARRMKAIIQLVCNSSGNQVFITDTDPNRISSVFSSSSAGMTILNVSKGEILTKHISNEVA